MKILKRNNLHKYQEKAVQFIKAKKRCALFIDMGLGKEQPISEPILTPDGWTTLGKINNNHEVIGSSGKPIKVLGVYHQGIKDVYKVTFSDGTSTRCGIDHLWGVNIKQKYYKKTDKRYDVLSLKQIIEQGLVGDTGFKFNIPVVLPIKFKYKELSIDPYLLGLLLGDGGFTSRVLSFTNSEDDLLKYVENKLPKYNKRKFENHYQIEWSSTYIDELKELSLFGLYSNEKFIPSDYLFSSIKQRISLLSGLINTDGSIVKNVSVNFTSTSHALANGVCYLARSLGFVCTQTIYHRKDGKNSSHAVHIMGDISILSLSYKHKSRLKPLRKGYYRSITNIEKLGKEESVCIKVDSPDSLYITKDYILTHNTCSTLTAIKDLSDDFAICRTLIIAPLRVANSVWKQEAQKWEHTQDLKINICTGTTKQRQQALSCDADIYVINRENVKWLVDNYYETWKWDTIVIDESSSFKSHSSQRFKALKSITHLTNYMILLTGTPASNGYMDLWSQSYLIDKGESLGKNITAYRNRFFNQFGFNYTLNKGAEKIIQERILPFTISMSAEDYLELPECLYLYNKINMPDKLHTKYKNFARDLILEYDDTCISAINATVLTNKLMQFTNGAIYDEEKKTHIIHDLKIDAIKEIIEEEPEEPLLISYNFKSDLQRLVKAFPNATVLDKDNKTIDLWNKGKIPMLLAHPASAGHGLNLQKGGSKIIWFGLNHSLELYEQFNARLNRQGQNKPVKIIHLILDKTIDQVVVNSLDKKANVQNDLIEYFNCKIK